MDKQLKFIHITKCAGTSIENTGKQNNILWGRFHKEYGSWHEFFPNKTKQLKLEYDWFTVVRNPYERLISEFYCKWWGINWHGKKDLNHVNEEEFNSHTKSHILSRSQVGNHYSEQYKYIDENVVIHIVHFENIELEFNELMRKYKLDIKLNRKDNQSISVKKFTVESFTPELIKLINEVYHKDFITFDYKKIDK